MAPEWTYRKNVTERFGTGFSPKIKDLAVGWDELCESRHKFAITCRESED